MRYDVAIIGAGAVGSAIARELSFYNISVIVLEKALDLADGTSGRNSAVVHAGFNNKPGSLMASLCVEGNQGFEELSRELDFPYKKTGKVIVAFDEEDKKTIEKLYHQGLENGCKGLRLIDKEELNNFAPGTKGIGGMYSADTAIINPFLYTVALAENAFDNGAKFLFNEKVVAIDKDDDGYQIRTERNTYQTRLVINSAGLYSDEIARMVSIDKYKIYPCRGEYIILDKGPNYKDIIPIYPAPKKGSGGLGVHLTPTTDGNVLIGPNAEYIDEKDSYETIKDTLDTLKKEASLLLPSVMDRPVIAEYTGLRSKLTSPKEGGYNDFIISEDKEGFINLVGIESPGLTASVPIARMVVKLVNRSIKLTRKEHITKERKGIVTFRDKSDEEKIKLIKENKEYGEIVCRCQKITKKEIKDAIENKLGVKTLSAIKYRAWPLTGRCGGGYCLPKITEILVKEYGIKPEDIRFRNDDSYMFTGETKDERV